MTLIDAILKKMQSNESNKRYASPPPELDTVGKKRAKRKDKHLQQYPHVRALVDTTSPVYDITPAHRSLSHWEKTLRDRYYDNLQLLMAIKKTYLEGGRVDSNWDEEFTTNIQYFKKRKDRYEKIKEENNLIYSRLCQIKPRVETTSSLNRQWTVNKRNIIQAAECKFVLFPVIPEEHMEDQSFVAPPGYKRPRVYMTLRTRGAAILGTLTLELFTDVCPNTCNLFLDLVDGDGLGYGYVGTQFFRKVPNMYWSGGDVVFDKGFGCYAQRGRSHPISAENYHFSHSMPGLLSMRTNADDEVCGIFNITFKRMSQFDLKNVIFGRVIRPCRVYDIIKSLGSPLSSYPHIEVCATKRHEGKWIHGKRNTRLRK